MRNIDDEMIRRVTESFHTMSDEESDEIFEEMIRDGIMDREGHVLVRMPEGPPEWARPANGQPAESKSEKARRPRKRS